MYSKKAPMSILISERVSADASATYYFSFRSSFGHEEVYIQMCLYDVGGPVLLLPHTGLF